MLKPFLAYAAAGFVGCAAPWLVLQIARRSPPDWNPVWSALAVIGSLGVLSGLIAALLPARWLSVAIIVAAPLFAVSLVMFFALTQAGAYFWIWIGVALGSVAASIAGARIGARRR